MKAETNEAPNFNQLSDIILEISLKSDIDHLLPQRGKVSLLPWPGALTLTIMSGLPCDCDTYENVNQNQFIFRFEINSARVLCHLCVTQSSSQGF